MKYLLLTFFIAAAFAAPHHDSNEVGETDVESAWMMMPMGGSCSSTCGCHQRCKQIWWMPCNCSPCMPSCPCCKQTTTSTTTSTTTTTTTTTTPPPPQVPSTTPGNGCNGGGCCNQCSCSPCMMPVIWMCPPRCGSGSGCCNSGGSNCCNSSGCSGCGK